MAHYMRPDLRLSVIFRNPTLLMLPTVSSRHPAQARPQHSSSGIDDRARPHLLSHRRIHILVSRGCEVRGMAVDVNVLPVPGWSMVDFVIDRQVWVLLRMAVPPIPAAVGRNVSISWQDEG